MTTFMQGYRLAIPIVLLLFSIQLMGCATGTAGSRIDNIPMYGQPEIPRPDVLKEADQDFIKQASSEFNGSREMASKAWNTEANKHMSRGNLDYAMRRYNQSWLLNPKNYQPYWGFGRVALERNHMDEAIEHLEKAIKICDNTYQKVALLSDTGTAYSYKAESIPISILTEKIRNFERANHYFTKSIALDPSYVNSWRRWAHSLFREGNYSESWVKIKKAQSLGATRTDTFIGNLAKEMPEPK